VNETARPAATSHRDPKAIEQDLDRFSRRIDRSLRRHYATHAVRRLLSPPKTAQERGRRFALNAPSRWLVLLSAFALAAAAVSHYRIELGRWLPRAWMAEFPVVPWWWAALAVVALLAVERLLLPRLLLFRHRFRLMRLERNDGQGEFPSVYSVARVADADSGFGWQSWRGVGGVEPGDLVIAISDRRDRGLGLILLRTEGRLPAVAFDRDLYLHKALPPLPEAVRALVHEFDRACSRNAENAAKRERTVVLRSGQTQPKSETAPAFDPGAAWNEIVLAEPVKAHLMALARDFAEGRATASRGLLLYGPPGTGKSLIAKTFARSMDCAFFPLSLPDLKSGYVGQSGEQVKTLWRKALGESRAVIFIDECEGVFGRRGGVNTDSAVEEIVAAFLAQWDGFDKHDHVWVVGATNRRDLIDAAILSRFEEQLEIGLPDGTQRLRILGQALARLGLRDPLPAQAEIMTQGMSGRELAALAKRLARECEARRRSPGNAGTHAVALDDAMLASATAAMRQQGSTATDAAASWNTLVLSDDTLRELKTTAGLLQHADAFRKRGIGVPRGLLLYGPPGTGKTQIARTLANETGLRFIAVSTADIKQGHIGQSGQKVRELFERARESAPSLLFIDEIDIVASARGGGDSFQTEIVGQLLQEMDGAKAQPQPVFVLAATNRIDQLDPAVLSRLPKRIEIPLPGRDDRVRMLAVMLRGKPLAFDPQAVAQALAARTDGRSGRDLRHWVEAAEHRAVARAIEAGDPETIAIRIEDFD
jgi:SpoVK/Ycf46/Vps4 family AAA+-type ATPase